MSGSAANWRAKGGGGGAHAAVVGFGHGDDVFDVGVAPAGVVAPGVGAVDAAFHGGDEVELDRLRVGVVLAVVGGAAVLGCNVEPEGGVCVGRRGRRRDGEQGRSDDERCEAVRDRSWCGHGGAFRGKALAGGGSGVGKDVVVADDIVVLGVGIGADTLHGLPLGSDAVLGGEVAVVRLAGEYDALELGVGQQAFRALLQT